MMKDLANKFKALSNPHRLKIYLALVDCCGPGIDCEVEGDETLSRCVGDLGKSVGIAASTLSHHLKELEHSGLIYMKRKGKNILCGVEEGGLAALKEFIDKAKICT